MDRSTKKLLACLVTIDSAALILALGTAYGLFEFQLFILTMIVGLCLLFLPKLTKRSLANLILPPCTPKQKFAHSFGGLIIFALGMLYGRETAIVFISACILTYITYEAFRWFYIKEPLYLSKVMESLGSLEEELGKPYLNPISALTGFLVAYTLFPLVTASISVIVLSIGDGVAPTAGRIVGLMKNPLNPNKTLGGSIVGFLASLAICLTFAKPEVAIAGCAAGMIAECLPLGIEDNFLVPVASVLGAAIINGI
ncbi:MAG: diacylglycerol/polyprenol kinase family protein [Thermoproteota archaeon]